MRSIRTVANSIRSTNLWIRLGYRLGSTPSNVPIESIAITVTSKTSLVALMRKTSN